MLLILKSSLKRLSLSYAESVSMEVNLKEALLA